MLEYTEKFLKRWQNDPLIHAAVAPHSIYTCSQENSPGFRRSGAQISRADLDSRGRNEKRIGRQPCSRIGLTPVQYLERIGILGPDVLAAHCIFVDDKDRKILAAAPSRLRPQSFQQHDAGQRRCPGCRRARRRHRGWPRHRRARRQQQRPRLDGRNGPRRQAAENSQDGPARARRKIRRGDGHHRRRAKRCTWKKKSARSKPGRKPT